ncbi:MAG: mechanosensitive ion channel domain-containing protein [Nitrososphaerales archaeon]
MQDQKITSSKKSTQAEFKALVIKLVILIATVRISIALFEDFFAPNLGLRHNHILIGETMATIVVSFIVITSIRGVLKRAPTKIPAHLIASISFFSIIIISLIASLILLYIWGVSPQTILVGGGVAAIVVGLGVSTIVGNILSGALMLTTFPAKIGDSIYIVNDNVHGTIEEISALYTKINTADGTEYIVPNSAIIQGNVRLIKEEPLRTLLPYVEGDKIELSNGSEKFSGIVTKITSRFTTILDSDKEIIVANRSILEGTSIIIKKSKTAST